MTPPPYRAVIFDMDGVLTDSEPAFHAAVNDILVKYGKHISMREYQPNIGVPTPKMWERVLKMKDVPVSLDDVIEAYEAPLMCRLREPRPPLPGARELIGELRRLRVPIALCTASYMRWADAILEGAGLRACFNALSTADMVEQTKPAPAPYLLAAEKLGVPASQCVVVEDSHSGLTSALRAGCYVVQLRATATSFAPLEGVHRVITSLAEFPLELMVTPAA